MRALVAVLAACGTAPSPPIAQPPAPAPALAARYAITSTIDVPIELVVPASGETAVTYLRLFAASPGAALVKLAGGDDLPARLTDKLAVWIDEELAKRPGFAATGAQDLATTLVATVEHVLASFGVVGTLAITGPTVTHAIATLDFEIATYPLARSTTAAISVTGTAVAIADHRFSLEYGTFAWQAIEARATSALGQSVRELVGAAVGCAQLAPAIAAKQVGPIAVGHAPEIAKLCERGLDTLVAKTRAKVEGLRFDALRFSSGTATVTADGLAGGRWTIEVDAGQGPRPTKGVFAASRAL